MNWRKDLAATLLLVLFALSSFASGHPVARSTASQTQINGIEYIQLDDWARSSQFQLKWATREEMRLTSSSTTLSFTADSRKVLINGIQVWLSFPVALRHGSMWVSSIDIHSAISPAIFPPRSAAKAFSTICLDAGHGGKDPGNREGRQQEKVHTLALAKDVRTLLTKAGFKVQMTRSFDRFVDLGERARWAKDRGADLFISLHFNSADGPGAAAVNGIEVFCVTPAGAASTNARGEGATGSCPGNRFEARSVQLAYQLQKSLVRGVGAEDRGVKRARFAVLRFAEMPAVLIEGGFMTNPAESRKIYSPEYRQQLARAILDGTLAYKKAVEQ